MISTALTSNPFVANVSINKFSSGAVAATISAGSRLGTKATFKFSITTGPSVPGVGVASGAGDEQPVNIYLI